MTNKCTKTEEIEILLEEYKQVYECYRHNDNMASNKEAIFAVAAFGVLAFALTKNFELWQAVGAAVVSIALYLYHVLAFNRMHLFMEMNLSRIRGIEERINMLCGSDKDILCFQMKYHKYKKKAKKEVGNWPSVVSQ